VTSARAARVVIPLLALALVPFGCGGDDDEPADQPGIQTSAPPSQFEPEPPVPDLAGTIAVVDLAGMPAAEPRRLQFSSDASVEDIRWRGWGSTRAIGVGTARVLVCRPTCGEGKVRSFDARVTLSTPIECEGQRYYDRARISIDDPPEQRPQAFIEAPC
jgi:hypothetical protein